MHIPEGLFANRYNQTSTRLVEKRFDSTTEDEIRRSISTVYAQGLWVGKSKIYHMLYEHSRQGIFPPSTLEIKVL